MLSVLKPDDSSRAGMMRTYIDKDGGHGQNRTTDTRIFSRVLRLPAICECPATLLTGGGDQAPSRMARRGEYNRMARLNSPFGAGSTSDVSVA